MQVKICEHYDTRWDEFVLAHSAGTFFHQWKWREIISTAFGYAPYYLLAEEQGELQRTNEPAVRRFRACGHGPPLMTVVINKIFHVLHDSVRNVFASPLRKPGYEDLELV